MLLIETIKIRAKISQPDTPNEESKQKHEPFVLSVKESSIKKAKPYKAFVDDLIDLGITNDKAKVSATHTHD